MLTLLSGTIGFNWDDAEGGESELVAPASIVIPPTVPHHVEMRGPFTLDDRIPSPALGGGGLLH